MKKILITSLLSLLVSCVAMGQKICSVNHQYRADLKVYVVDSEFRADLLVFKTNNEYCANANENKGIWFFTDKEYRADKKVYFVDHEYQADLKIYFVDSEYRAGWRDKSKQPLLY